MDIEQIQAAHDSFMIWWQGVGEAGISLEDVIEDNRRRYRMELSDKDLKRQQNDLSCLPSTKSRSLVDTTADAFLAEYHQEPDSISYVARLNSPKPQPGIPTNDELARWLTEIFHYRAEYTSGFYQWHDSSIRAGLTDGFEAAMTYWQRHSYSKVTGKQNQIDGIPLSEQDLPIAMMVAPDRVQSVDIKEEIVTCDTWWIDKLIPGETVFWDIKIPRMDVNLGEFVLVKLNKTFDQIKDLADKGVFDKFKSKKVKDLLGVSTTEDDDLTEWADPKDIDDELINRGEVWAYFYKDGFESKVIFSLAGKEMLSSAKSVNDVYFGGRSVNKFPVVVGIMKASLHEVAGVGIPWLIASHEDEWNTNRNAIQEASKQSLNMKWRIDKGADVDITQLLTKPAFYADAGEVERIDNRQDINNILRSNDTIGQEISELVPTSVSTRGRSIVPKGANATLGTVQMMEMDSLTKKNAQMRLRNETFLKPLLYLIAELIFAHETDEMIARIAGQRGKVPVPEAMTMQGQTLVDFSKLDFPVDVSINAGLGNTPKYQKAQNLMQIAGWRQQNGIPTDFNQIAQQLNVLAGFDRDQFAAPPPQPPPPEVEYKCTINIGAEMLPPDVQQVLLKKLVEGQMSATANIKSDSQLALMQQNGGMGAPPDRTGLAVTDGMGTEAQGMSEGGQWS
jgi:hypothetical protein